MIRIVGIVAVAGAIGLLGRVELASQELPDEFQNLQILDKDISKDELKAVMTGFTAQLGVKCTHCHILDEYEKDDKEHKQKARKMLQLIAYLRQNAESYFGPEMDREKLSCWTCHRGEAEVTAFTPEDDDDWM
jgi:hypothetical protein